MTTISESLPPAYLTPDTPISELEIRIDK